MGDKPKAIPIEDKSLIAMEREELGPDYVIFDHTNPRALINMVPNSMKVVMEALDDKHRYLSEPMLKRYADADALLARLRINFWLEYDSAQKIERNMSISNILRGVTSMDYWNDVVLKDPKKVAYIIVPPKNYLVTMNELLEMGLDRMREILKAPVFDSRGRFDAKAADKIIKVVHAVEARVKGAVVQKTLNLNAEMPAQRLGIENIDVNSSNLDELEAQIAKVKAKLEGKENSKNEEGRIAIDDSGVIEGEVVGKTQNEE